MRRNAPIGAAIALSINIAGRLLNNAGIPGLIGGQDVACAQPGPSLTMPRLRTALFTLIAASMASPAVADCYADYRAKMDDPLRLHYGVMEIPDAACSVAAAAPVIAARLADAGWDLLQVVSVFDQSGLAPRRADAGDHFLRF